MGRDMELEVRLVCVCVCMCVYVCVYVCACVSACACTVHVYVVQPCTQVKGCAYCKHGLLGHTVFTKQPCSN